MIAGIGTDLIRIDRVIKACEKESFLKRVFTEKERQLIAGNQNRAASNFAVKEAVAKALGTGFRGFGPEDVEVLRDSLGRPFVNLYGKALSLSREKGIGSWHVTLSHTDVLVTATVIGETLGDLPGSEGCCETGADRGADERMRPKNN